MAPNRGPSHLHGPRLYVGTVLIPAFETVGKRIMGCWLLQHVDTADAIYAAIATA